ncbi:diguanylate cyclase [Photobacterium carnosum]|uniref:diguanylate cyclase n=1 Tax=Photobacterium carnosum TaxID=2023717 RepID=UPI002431DE85|nr:diguanylate cyclase [Photobacterium carnosum]
MLDLLDEKYKKSSVLVVDDENLSLELSNRILSPLFTVYLATNGEQAIEYALFYKPDLILLDIMMEGLDGTDICYVLKSKPETKNIPVIFVTSHYEDNMQMKCWKAGCVDFITKPINHLTLTHRVKTHIEHKIKTEILESLIKKDRLTNISNRFALDEDYPVAINYCQRNLAYFSLLMIDIDDFKLFNDTYGHTSGDNTLIKVASIIKKSLSRSTDNVYRFGGEEFVILLPNTNNTGAEMLSKKIISALNSNGIENKKTKIGYVTISIGGVTYFSKNIPNDMVEALNVADNALYKIKGNGKNGYFIEDNELPQQTILNSSTLLDKEISLIKNSEDKSNYYMCWDKESSMNRIGDDRDFYIEIIEIFINTFPEYALQLGNNIDNNDRGKVIFFSHKLKGICGDIGADRLYEFLTIIETIAKLDNIEIIGEIYNKLLLEFKLVKNLMNNEFNFSSDI